MKTSSARVWLALIDYALLAFISMCLIMSCMVRRSRDSMTVTIPPELIAWLDEMVDKRTFSSRSHGVELCILKYKEEAERERK